MRCSLCSEDSRGQRAIQPVRGGGKAVGRDRRRPLKPMKCKDIQFLLPLYPDNVLDEGEQSLVAGHIDTCPVCRQKLFDFKAIKNNLRAAGRPQFAPVSLDSLRRNIARKAAPAASPMFQALGDRRRWTDVWLMPFAVGSLSTLIIGFTLLWVIVSSEIQPRHSRISPGTSTANTTVLYPYQSPLTPIESDLNPRDYAISRASISQESPSINPRGSLVLLTRNLVDEISDGEVTVIADVHGNGSATIAQVVEPSSDQRAVDELQKALGSDPSVAAFVPASYDQRSEPVRVVFKLQSVSVSTKLR